MTLLEAIRAAFDAGAEWGENSATSYEWGCGPRQKKNAAFAEFMDDRNEDSAPLRALTQPKRKTK